MHFALSPGASGLNIIQALGFNVPVIGAFGNPESGPEIEAINFLRHIGFQYNHPEELDSSIIVSSKSTKEEYQKLCATGKNLVLDKYTTEPHAERIINAILNFVD